MRPALVLLAPVAGAVVLVGILVPVLMLVGGRGSPTAPPGEAAHTGQIGPEAGEPEVPALDERPDIVVARAVAARFLAAYLAYAAGRGAPQAMRPVASAALARWIATLPPPEKRSGAGPSPSLAGLELTEIRGDLGYTLRAQVDVPGGSGYSLDVFAARIGRRWRVTGIG